MCVCLQTTVDSLAMYNSTVSLSLSLSSLGMFGSTQAEIWHVFSYHEMPVVTAVVELYLVFGVVDNFQMSFFLMLVIVMEGPCFRRC